MKTAFIIKGTLKAKPLFKELESNFSAYAIFETKRAAHAIELAKDAVEKNYTHIIAVGGDGTLSEVVNGMLLSGKKNLPVLGCLSYGTANDFCKTARLNGTVRQLKNLIEKNSVKKVDAGKVSFTDKNGNSAERYFINIGDIGIGGCIVENINNSSKILGANGTFFLETVKTLFTYKKTRMKCRCEEFEWEGKTLSMVMANAKYFGSGLCIAPDAKLDDGKFSIVVLGDVTIIDYLKNLNKLKRGEKFIHPEIFYKETNEIKITPLEGKVPIDLDGEFIGYAPAIFKVVPAKINFLME